MIDPLSAIAGFLSGGAFGAIIAACISHCRAKADRKRTFLSFLAARKQEVSSERYRTDPKAFGGRYEEFQIEFRQQAALVTDTIKKGRRRKFDELIGDIVGHAKATAATEPGIQRLLKIIAETEEFIDTA